ncbi:hypothetical protein PSPO01_06804 [Paraphaeosphaeria sporulosa]
MIVFAIASTSPSPEAQMLVWEHDKIRPGRRSCDSEMADIFKLLVPGAIRVGISDGLQFSSETA